MVSTFHENGKGLLVACRDLPIIFFSFKRFELSDTEKVERRKAHLSH